jgi:hypothetical protein
MYESNFHVTGFSYGSNTRDDVGRVSCSRVAFDVAATATSIHLHIVRSNHLLVDTGRHRLQPAIQARVSALLPTFGPRILAAALGTFS